MPRNPSDIELQAMPIDEAKTLIEGGWRLGYDRADKGKGALEVWLQSPTDKREFRYCHSRDFPALAAHERSVKRESKSTVAILAHRVLAGNGAVYSYAISGNVLEAKYRSSRHYIYRWTGLDSDLLERFELSKNKCGFIRENIQGQFSGERIDTRAVITDISDWQKTLDAMKGSPSGFCVEQGGAA